MTAEKTGTTVVVGKQLSGLLCDCQGLVDFDIMSPEMPFNRLERMQQANNAPVAAWHWRRASKSQAHRSTGPKTLTEAGKAQE